MIKFAYAYEQATIIAARRRVQLRCEKVSSRSRDPVNLRQKHFPLRSTFLLKSMASPFVRQIKAVRYEILLSEPKKK